MYLVPFLKHSISNIGFSLKSELPIHVIQGMAPFDRAYWTSYEYAVVSTAISCTCTILEITDVEEFLDHEI